MNPPCHNNEWASAFFHPPDADADAVIAAEAEAIAARVHTSSILPRSTDHSYHDFSTYIEDGGEIKKHKKSERNFPARLHTILSDAQYAHIISWMPHGRAWKVLNKSLFVDEVIPKFFGHSKFASFTRQLSGWGFKRLHQTGPDFGCYYHECFLRGHPKLTVLMRRMSPGLGKSAPNVHEEPDFYAIAIKYPLEKLQDVERKAAAAAVAPNMDGQLNHQWDSYRQFALMDAASQYCANHYANSKSVEEDARKVDMTSVGSTQSHAQAEIVSSYDHTLVHQGQEADANQYYFGSNVNQNADNSSYFQYLQSQQQLQYGLQSDKFHQEQGDRNPSQSNCFSAQGLFLAEGSIPAAAGSSSQTSPLFLRKDS